MSRGATRILSFDVGIKNLAQCYTENSSEQWRILDWGVEDLREDAEEGRAYPTACCGLTGKGNVCQHAAVYQVGGDRQGYCRVHARGLTDYQHPADVNNVKKMKVDDLREQAKRFAVEHEEPPRRKMELKDWVLARMGERIVAKIPAKRKCKSMPAHTVHDGIIHFLRKSPHLLEADQVVIENQPVKTNAQMKTVQMLLQATLRMLKLERGLSVGECVTFINADKKLTIPERFPRLFTDDSLTRPEELSRRKRLNYAERKKQAIALVESLLAREDLASFARWFAGHKKRDDLSDTLLMCLQCACDRFGLVAASGE